MKLEREKGGKNNSSDLGILWKYSNNNACLFCLKPVWQACDLPSRRRIGWCLILGYPERKPCGQTVARGRAVTLKRADVLWKAWSRWRELHLTGATEHVRKIRKACAGHRGPVCAHVHLTCVLKSLLVTRQESKTIWKGQMNIFPVFKKEFARVLEKEK